MNANSNRMMIAGASSGCGKTTVTCAILQALVNRGLKVTSFKCGPDYIDPMFHSRIIGTESRNLDSYFCDCDTLNTLLHRNAGEVSVIEGVMGFYDGAGERGSSYQASEETETPVVVVLDSHGMGQSLGAVVKGFLTFRKPNRIAGFVFNRLSERMETVARELCRELGTEYYGRLPYLPEAAVESRHLGLVTAGEIQNLQEKMQLLAGAAEQYIRLDALLELAGTAGMPEYREVKAELARGDLSVAKSTHEVAVQSNFQFSKFSNITQPHPRIALARDEAFCFYYEDNLMLLRDLGCEIVPFSPLHDTALPEHIGGLILPGGYPELYAEQLMANQRMREAVREAVLGGLPTIAECGGFLYLGKSLRTADGTVYEMAGALDGEGFPTGKLQRFGYVTLTAQHDNLLCKAGETLTAHEFHYWDSTAPGDAFTATKVSTGASYSCAVATETLYAGFPHFYLWGNTAAARRFAERAAWKQQVR